MKKSVVHLAVVISVMTLLPVFVLGIGVATSTRIEAAVPTSQPASAAIPIQDFSFRYYFCAHCAIDCGIASQQLRSK